MPESVQNKQGKFGVKILWHYTDMAIFVLRCFILTHPVDFFCRNTKHDSSFSHKTFLAANSYNNNSHKLCAKTL